MTPSSFLVWRAWDWTAGQGAILSPKPFTHWVILGLRLTGVSRPTEVLGESLHGQTNSMDGQTEHPVFSHHKEHDEGEGHESFSCQGEEGELPGLWDISNHLWCPDLVKQQVSADHPGHRDSVDRWSLKEAELGCPGISPTVASQCLSFWAHHLPWNVLIRD